MKNCVVCNAEFRPKGNYQKLCGSHECHLARRRITEDRVIKERECRHCENNFLPTHGGRYYCSNECFAESRRIRTHVIPQDKECLVCGSLFFYGRSDKKICSAKCKKTHVKDYKKKFNKNIIEECVVCGVEFNKVTTAITCSEECRQIQRKHYRNKWRIRTDYYNNPTVAISRRISNRLRATLKHKKILKNNRTFEILGYGKEDLKEHFESYFTEENGYSWDNMSEWHIDHIRPVASFNFDSTGHPDFKKCWALNNLQPLWAKDNMSKNDKWNGVVNA